MHVPQEAYELGSRHDTVIFGSQGTLLPHRSFEIGLLRV